MKNLPMPMRIIVAALVGAIIGVTAIALWSIDQDPYQKSLSSPEEVVKELEKLWEEPKSPPSITPFKDRKAEEVFEEDQKFRENMRAFSREQDEPATKSGWFSKNELRNFQKAKRAMSIKRRVNLNDCIALIDSMSIVLGKKNSNSSMKKGSPHQSAYWYMPEEGIFEFSIRCYGGEVNFVKIP